MPVSSPVMNTSHTHKHSSVDYARGDRGTDLLKKHHHHIGLQSKLWERELTYLLSIQMGLLIDKNITKQAPVKESGMILRCLCLTV